MLPKNSKHYIQPTAEQLDMDPQLVEDIIEFYYSTVRKYMVNLEHYNIRIENLGSFRIKKKELPLLVKKYNKHLSILTKDTFNQMNLRKEAERKLENVLRVQQLIESERERKYNFLIQHGRIKEKVSIRKDLEIPETDS